MKVVEERGKKRVGGKKGGEKTVPMRPRRSPPLMVSAKGKTSVEGGKGEINSLGPLYSLKALLLKRGKEKKKDGGRGKGGGGVSLQKITGAKRKGPKGEKKETFNTFIEKKKKKKGGKFERGGKKGPGRSGPFVQHFKGSGKKKGGAKKKGCHTESPGTRKPHWRGGMGKKAVRKACDLGEAWQSKRNGVNPKRKETTEKPFLSPGQKQEKERKGKRAKRGGNSKMDVGGEGRRGEEEG